MKPTYEQAVEWAKGVSGVEFPVGIAGVKIGMSPEHLERFAALAYEAGRKDENEACERICQENPTMPAILVTDAIRARREQ